MKTVSIYTVKALDNEQSQFILLEPQRTVRTVSIFTVKALENNEDSLNLHWVLKDNEDRLNL